MTAIPIPDDVRDNSEKVTDYAFRRDIAQTDWPFHEAQTRDNEIARVGMFPKLGLKRYQWDDVNPDGQRCRFDMIVNVGGVVVNLYHTEYFTRVPCCTHDAHYAVYYASVTDGDGVTTIPGPYCDECMIMIRQSVKDSGMVLNLSERLRIGQHD
jgi:hypothetical protein